MQEPQLRSVGVADSSAPTPTGEKSSSTYSCTGPLALDVAHLGEHNCVLRIDGFAVEGRQVPAEQGVQALQVELHFLVNCKQHEEYGIDMKPLR